MNNVLQRLGTAALATAAIFTMNTLNNLTEASASTKFDDSQINQKQNFPVAFSPFNK